MPALTPRTTLIAGALFAASGVVLGAFGAHGLKDVLAAEQLSTWQTAVLYQFVHALALLVTGALALHPDRLALPSNSASRAASAFVFGVILFSGSLYALALGAPRWLGPVTPFGGLAFIAGWLLLLAGLIRGIGHDDE